MSDELKPVAERSYRIGDVGDGARIAQGENISWVEEVARLPDGPALAQQFAALLERISKDTSLDEDTRELAKAKTGAVAEGLAKAQESPAAFRRALLDAKSWFGGTVSWVGHALGDILKSEAAPQREVAHGRHESLLRMSPGRHTGMFTDMEAQSRAD